jgi:hypothetical protein
LDNCGPADRFGFIVSSSRECGKRHGEGHNDEGNHYGMAMAESALLVEI